MMMNNPQNSRSIKEETLKVKVQDQQQPSIYHHEWNHSVCSFTLATLGQGRLPVLTEPSVQKQSGGDA